MLNTDHETVDLTFAFFTQLPGFELAIPCQNYLLGFKTLIIWAY